MHFDSFSEEAFNAYLAGFTDGDGYVGCKLGMGVRITLANCVPEVLYAIQERLGYGRIKSQHQKPHWRERFVLDIANMKDASDFLARTRPYALIKREAMDKMLDHISANRAKHQAIVNRNEEIRKRAASGEMREAIAHEYGVSSQLISRICKGLKWTTTRSQIAQDRRRDAKGRFI